MNLLQKTNKIELPKLELPDIHGHTKIELYNPKTRVKSVTESDNTFQATALANFMKDYGYFDANLYRSETFRNRPFWANLVGGLLLFRDAITVGYEFAPAGNKMVGNGSYGVTNNGTPVELGSYNSVETSATSSAITQVYDFTTSQANGTIGCVCLTSADGGLIGYGNPSGAVLASASRVNFNNSQSPRTSLSGRHGYYNNYIYSFPESVTSGSMKITKTRVPVTQGSVFDFTGPQNGDTYETITISTSAMTGASNWNLAGNYYIDDTVYDCGNGKFRFLPWNNSWGYSTAAAGAKIYFFEFDATTDSLSIGEFTNSSGESVSYTDIVNDSHGAIFGGDYCLASNKLFKISDSTFIKSTSYVRGGPSYDYDSRAYYIGNDMFVGFNRVNYNDTYYLLDTVNQTEYPINANNGIDLCSQLGNLRGGYKNPLYLATINNIQAVTKTAAQTMKVTYTLTEA